MDICRASSRTVTTSSAQSAPRTSCLPTTDQSQTSIVISWPITDQYCDLVTNHRSVLWSCDQSQIGIVILWPFGTSGRCDHLLESWSGVDPDSSQSGERAVKHLTVILQFYLAHTFSPAVSLSKYFTSDSSTFSLLITSTFSRRYRS